MVEKSLKVSLEVWDSAKKFAVSHNDTLQNFVETAIKEKISREHVYLTKEEPPQQQPQADSLPKTEPVKKPEKTVEEEDPYAELKKALNEK